MTIRASQSIAETVREAQEVLASRRIIKSNIGLFLKEDDNHWSGTYTICLDGYPTTHSCPEEYPVQYPQSLGELCLELAADGLGALANLRNDAGVVWCRWVRGMVPMKAIVVSDRTTSLHELRRAMWHRRSA